MSASNKRCIGDERPAPTKRRRGLSLPPTDAGPAPSSLPPTDAGPAPSSLPPLDAASASRSPSPTDADRTRSLYSDSVKLFPHQVEALRNLKRILSDKKVAVDMSPVGAGKTVTTLELMLEMVQGGTFAVVVTTKTVQSAWTTTQKQLYPGAQLVVVKGGPRKRADRFAEAERLIAESTPFILLITFSQLSLGIAERVLALGKIAMFVVDEFELRHLKAAKAAAAKVLRGASDYALVLSATPIQNTLKDLYVLATLLRPGWKTGEGECEKDCEELWDTLQGCVYAPEPSLRDWEKITRVVTVGGASGNTFSSLLAKVHLAHMDLQAAHELGFCNKRGNRLRGRAKRLFKEVDAVLKSVDTERLTPAMLDVVGDLVDESVVHAPVLVFANFLLTRDRITEFLQGKTHPTTGENLVVRQFTSTLKPAERTALIALFQRESDTEGAPDVLVVGEGTLNTGVTLTAARHIIMVPEKFNPASTDQVFGRIDRPGQEAERIMFTFVVDRRGDSARVFRTLCIKKHFNDRILSALRTSSRHEFIEYAEKYKSVAIRQVAAGTARGMRQLYFAGDATVRAALEASLPLDVLDAELAGRHETNL